jgi:hypothetical protein
MTENEIREQVSEDLRNFLDFPKTIFGEVPEGDALLEIEVSDPFILPNIF